MTTTRAAIEQALAAGPTDGPWVLFDPEFRPASFGITSKPLGHAVVWYGSHAEEGIDKHEDAAYIAAVNPAAMRKFIAEEDARHDAEKKALEDELVRVRSVLTKVASRERHRGTVFLDIEDLCEIDAALSPTTTKD